MPTGETKAFSQALHLPQLYNLQKVIDLEIIQRHVLLYAPNRIEEVQNQACNYCMIMAHVCMLDCILVYSMQCKRSRAGFSANKHRPDSPWVGLMMLTWDVCEEALRALAVVVPSMTNSPIWRPDSQSPAIKLTTTSISVLGGFIDDLIKGRVYVVCKLDFSYRGATHCSCSNAKADNALRVRIAHLLDVLHMQFRFQVFSSNFKHFSAAKVALTLYTATTCLCFL